MASIETPRATAGSFPDFRLDLGQALFPATIFASAALVFLVEPMVGKLLLPLLGGAPAVWNTALAFFQVALLLGYAYAHLLQRLPSLRLQVLVHGIVLCLAGLSLPLHISGALGEPSSLHPVLWLLGTLTVSVGLPFAALSATAPLVQAWFARTAPVDPVTGKPREPYALYAASNIGSLLALVAYPAVIEPLTRLSSQRLAWSLGFCLFAVLITALGLTRKPVNAVTHDTATDRPKPRDMLVWIGLAAAPSSLMMGVTTYITTDVASAPFLWVVPLALYLVTFILAFGDRPAPRGLGLAQAAALCACVILMPVTGGGVLAKLGIHLLCFFLTALVCHSALAARRPDPRHLTLFYLCMSLGGVLGGAFNAFVAPVAFNSVIEYPLVLVLACLARPWGPLKPNAREMAIVAASLACAAAVIAISRILGDRMAAPWAIVITVLLIAQAAAVFVLRDRAWLMAGLLAMTFVSGHIAGDSGRTLVTMRSFFGVTKISEIRDPVLGPVRVMYSGTTIHGAQALDPVHACQALTYYAPQTGIGQTITQLQSRPGGLNIAAIGLGAGIFSSYMRPSDSLTYYEIDPLVLKLADDSPYFSYTTHCAHAPVKFVMGDARLTLNPTPAGRLDLLMVDAFSSDAVPAHLLTVESVRMYMSKLKPGGVMIFNLTNRHLELRDPVLAAIRDAGGVALEQVYDSPDKDSLYATHTVTVLAAKSEAALSAFRANPRWQTRDPGKVQAWTDDYTNLIGAFLAHKG